jgi:hypothetical protein
MESTRVTINLDLDVTGEAISGHATDGEGRHRDFSGWLGLVGTLDALLTDAADPGAAPRADQTFTDRSR